MTNTNADEFSGWIIPSAAETEIRALGNSHTVRHALLQALKAGVVKAVAGQAVVDYGKQSQLSAPVNASVWRAAREDDEFWRTGIVEYEFRNSRTLETETVRLFNVRFEPDAVRNLLPPGTAVVAPIDAPATTKPPKPIDQKPVSPAALDHWYAAYKLTYVDNSEDRALESAERMFPDKVITRKKIRDIRGDRAMGRPKNED